ncbi:MAG: ribonuclease P protein component [Planctomycetota bacterium]|jgi:ribonuclease P protein component
MEKKDESFPKSLRILDRRDFKRIMESGKKRQDKRLVCYSRNNVERPTRIGIVVSKKFGGAVRRNRIKRLLREAFRLSRNELPPGLDVICIPKVSQEYTLDGFRNSLKHLLGSIDGINTLSE